MKSKVIVSFLSLLSITSSVYAAIGADRIHVVDAKKTQIYMKDGIFTGGHRDAEAASIRDIRRANNSGFERIVLDIGSPQIPYYQVAVDPTMKRITVTIFGDPALSFHAPQVVKAFQKSSTVTRVDLFPKVDGSTFSMVMQLKGVTPVEVFELTSPNRIIFDLKSTSGSVSAEHKPVTRFVGKKKTAPKKAEATQVYPAETSDAAGDDQAEAHSDESAPE